MYITEGEPYRPEAVIWLELPSELIVGWTLADPEAPPSFADTLREAMRRPHAGPPRRPARVRVADEALAGQARAALGERTEVVVAPTPELDLLIRSFAESLVKGDEGESYLEDGRVPPAAVERLFRAAQALYRIAPWTVANDGQIIRLDVLELGVRGAAISIIGALGESFGFLVFPSLTAFDGFARAAERMMGRARRRSPPERIDLGSTVLSLTFERARDLPPSMRREILKHGWPVAGTDAYPRVAQRERDGITRPLGEKDVQLAAACASALAAFVIKHGELFTGERLIPVSETYTGETGLTVRLTTPHESFETFENDEASELGPGWLSVEPALGGSAPAQPAAAHVRHVGRNDPCPCGSGKKYKRCHLGTGQPPPATAPAHERDGRIAQELTRYARLRFGDEWLRFHAAFADAERAALLALPWALYQFRVRGRPVARWFLEERGARLALGDRAWIEAQERAWLSVWEVEDARPGISLELVDLLTGERRHVPEATASRMLVRRDAVLGRIVDHEGVSLLCGVHPHPLPPVEAAAVASAIRARLRRGRTQPVERLRGERLGRELIAHWEEAGAALEERLRVPPAVRNTDGDALLFTTDRFEFDRSASAEVEERLAAMEGVEAPEEVEEDRDYAFVHEEGATRSGALPTVIGWARLGDGLLRLETNSARRADGLRRRIETAFGERLRYIGREQTEAETMLREAWERGAGPPADAPDPMASSPEAAEALREIKAAHYVTWADQPLPALAGKSAREAVRTARGRAQVDVLLKDIENREARLPAAERFDTAPVRRALGL